jgi:RNA polymerase sigma factor (TIGR02999 family)
MSPSIERTTEILQRLAGGEEKAADVLFPLLYAELKRVASAKLRREQRGHSLHTTELVHEAYLKLVNQERARWEDRAHFCAVAAQAMRRILVDHARSRGRAKRGAGAVRVPLLDADLPVASGGELVALDDALGKLARLDARQARVVELRYFGGLSVEETASVLGVSARTVKGDWRVARAWLKCYLETGETP